MYSIALTKCAILHRDYLTTYHRIIPPHFLRYIDDHRNCEDIAMAYLIAVQTHAAPVWTSVRFFDIASGGISSAGSSHFHRRSDCLKELEGLQPHGMSPWVLGQQKVVKVNWSNSWRLLFEKDSQ